MESTHKSFSLKIRFLKFDSFVTLQSLISDKTPISIWLFIEADIHSNRASYLNSQLCVSFWPFTHMQPIAIRVFERLYGQLCDLRSTSHVFHTANCSIDFAIKNNNLFALLFFHAKWSKSCTIVLDALIWILE